MSSVRPVVHQHVVDERADARAVQRNLQRVRLFRVETIGKELRKFHCWQNHWVGALLGEHVRTQLWRAQDEVQLPHVSARRRLRPEEHAERLLHLLELHLIVVVGPVRADLFAFPDPVRAFPLGIALQRHDEPRGRAPWRGGSAVRVRKAHLPPVLDAAFQRGAHVREQVA